MVGEQPLVNMRPSTLQSIRFILQFRAFFPYRSFGMLWAHAKNAVKQGHNAPSSLLISRTISDIGLICMRLSSMMATPPHTSLLVCVRRANFESLHPRISKFGRRCTAFVGFGFVTFVVGSGVCACLSFDLFARWGDIQRQPS
jgi:hypothetical protein